jgi:chaperonin GroEL
MGKEVIIGSSARAKMQDGLNTLANAVKTTLGPKGRHAAIERSYGAPLITKDGVTVAQSIDLKCRVENMGAQLIKSVASSTNTVAGDGTTTATVLAQSIYNDGAKMVAAGHNPVLIKRGIDLAVSKVKELLAEQAIDISGEDAIKSVATISANNDISLGNMIADAISTVGDDGVISVEEATGGETSVSYTEGTSFDRGFLSPLFVTNAERMSVEFSNPYILLYDGVITSSQEILPLLQEVSKDGGSLLIIAKDVVSEALQTLILNKARGTLSVCATKSPGFGDIRADIMGDIATLCGGNLFTGDGPSLREVTLDNLGRARKVLVSRTRTSIIDGAGSQEDIDDRVSSIKVQLESDDLFTHHIASLRDRLSTMSGAVAIFKVGGASESEMRERKDRVEDAINAVTAALSEGIVSGGGAALLHCVSPLSKHFLKIALTQEERIGVDIVTKSIKSPFIQILTNAGVDYHEFMEKIIKSKNTVCGFNALFNSFEGDMLEAGIVDPAKVVRSALENAASASGTLLTTEVTISTEEPKE